MVRRSAVAAALAGSAGICAEFLAHRAFTRLVQTDVEALRAEASAGRAGVVAEEMLSGLPEPVRRYLTYTGVVGKPFVRLARLTQKGKMRLGLDCQLVRNRSVLMILPAGVTKGTGLLEALAVVGLSRHNAIGLGDAENDHSLLDVCEVGVAVANAVDAIRAHADIVLTLPAVAKDGEWPPQGPITESRTTTTGQVAWCTQCWPTEPSRASANPPCPRLPTTSRSAPADASSSTRAALPSTTLVVIVTGSAGLDTSAMASARTSAAIPWKSTSGAAGTGYP